MASEEVSTKLLRFLSFAGAGVVCTAGINMWRDLERKAALQKAVEGASEKPGTIPSENAAATAAAEH
ncbi:unnamed protein product [Spirodela intermedia]|uniref:Uncharacterized protein n=2 Tax=Spirodela intermedia TaxID=51605 RepID=A0A7I8J874_SPIIN|nr:unnamed protein product [Spirodela intermedia]CAA6665632.1 unnamed protein product [Spirodela intermedia]CAA7402365.1 unnamed protein product [Spirodela intermedia]